MFTEEFLVRVVLSFLVGGIYIGAMTRISEKFGSKIGGLLISLPSTALVGLAFIALTQNQDALVAATTVMPSSIAASTIFLVVFVILNNKFGWLISYAGAIAVWFALNLPLVIAGIESISLSVFIAIILLSISVRYFHKHPHRKLPPMEVSKKVFIFRVVFAGSFIALAVLFAKLAGPEWGGLFSSFPAAFSATVILFSRAHGVEFISSLSRSMVQGGVANVVFATGVFFFAQAVGSALGIIFAYLVCLAFATFSYRFVNRI
jgi:uncharacterized membrane protein (GlpM family)